MFFWGVFLFLSRDFRGLVGITNPWFLGGFFSLPLLALSQKKTRRGRTGSFHLHDSRSLLGGWVRGSGGVKSTDVSQTVRETSRDESQSVPYPERLCKTRDLELPIFLGISPKLFAALRRIHPYLCTPVLPRGQGGLAKTSWKFRPVPPGGFLCRALVLREYRSRGGFEVRPTRTSGSLS